METLDSTSEGDFPSSTPRRCLMVTDAVTWANSSQDRWASPVIRFAGTSSMRAIAAWVPRDVERIPGRPSKRRSEFFVKVTNEQFDILSALERGTCTGALARARSENEWRRCSYLLLLPTDQGSLTHVHQYLQ